MPIDSVTRLNNYRVDASNETSDQERRREDKKGGRRSPKLKTDKNPSTHLPEMATQPNQIPSDLGGASQNVDTSHVIELLTTRPTLPPPAPDHAFKVRELATSESVPPEHRHVDKRY